MKISKFLDQIPKSHPEAKSAHTPLSKKTDFDFDEKVSDFLYPEKMNSATTGRLIRGILPRNFIFFPNFTGFTTKSAIYFQKQSLSSEIL